MVKYDLCNCRHFWKCSITISVTVVTLGSGHFAVFFGCVRQDVTHDTFIGTSWLRNYRQMWLSGYSALTLETSAPGLPGYYVICSCDMNPSHTLVTVVAAKRTILRKKQICDPRVLLPQTMLRNSGSARIFPISEIHESSSDVRVG